jgi:hypothetical protein
MKWSILQSGSFTPWGKSLDIDRSQGRPHSQYRYDGEEKISCSIWESNPSHAAHSLLLY